MLTLSKHPNGPLTKQVLLVVLDGVGFTKHSSLDGNAIDAANLPVLKSLWKNHPTVLLQAHGKAVGMPSDEDMGNSEVGHNVLGSGRIFDQGAKLVCASIDSGALFQGEIWKKLINNVNEKNSTLHFLGLFSDGNVHSHIDHLKAMIQKAKEGSVKKIRIHILLDGRDVPEKSALDYLIPFEDELKSLLNKYSMENASNTPDFILAEYLMRCLDNYNRTVQRRHAWMTPPRPLPEIKNQPD